jgi:hypothetical protein
VAESPPNSPVRLPTRHRSDVCPSLGSPLEASNVQLLLAANAVRLRRIAR